MITLTAFGAQLQRNPLQTLNGLRDSAHGVVPLAHRPCFAVLVTNPALVQFVLTDERFVKSAATLQFRGMIGDGTATSWFPQSGSRAYAPFANLEELRRAKRRAIAPAFAAKQWPHYGPNIRHFVTQAIREWKVGEVRDIYAEMNDLMFRIMIVCLFNRPTNADLMVEARVLRQSSGTVFRRLRSARAVFDRSIGGLPLWSLTLRRRQTAIRRIAAFLMYSAKADVSQTDDLISLLRAVGDDSDNGFTDEQMLSATIGLFLAGYENSASAAAWTLWCLATNPTISERFYQLQDEALRMEYLRACINEALRLYPPIWSTARVAKCQLLLGDHDIAAGSVLVVIPWLQGRQSQVWPEPDLFRPERFAATPTANGSYFPFGVGLQACPGEQFARTELTIVLSEILKRWKIEPAPNTKPPVPLLGATQRPQKGIHLKLATLDSS